MREVNPDTGPGPAEPPSAGNPARHPWRRYVAVGDSFTEGMGDPEPRSPGGYRGWADRVAEELSVGGDDFAYANLAVRGLLLRQIIDQQLLPAIELKPDLVTIQGGGNDLIHPGTDPDRLAGLLDPAVALLGSGGATVVMFVGPDSGPSTVLGLVRTKLAVFNENLRIIAARHGAVVADMWALRRLADPRMWDGDRLHLSPLGHHIIAAMVLDTLSVEHSLEPLESKPLPAQKWRRAKTQDLLWARDYLVPWVIRGIKHQSISDGITAKRPIPLPVRGPGILPAGQ